MDKVNYFETLFAKESVMLSWETVVTTMRSENMRQTTERYRLLCRQHDEATARGDDVAAKRIKSDMAAVKRSSPGIVCQTVVEGGRNHSSIRAYTGTFMVDFDHVPPDQLAPALQKVKDDCHTLLLYTTLSGRGFRVIARVEGGIGEATYRMGWLTVNEYYSRLTGLDYDRLCSDPTRLCGLAWDPDLVYRPLAKRLRPDPQAGRKPDPRRAGRPPRARKLGARVRETVEADGAPHTPGQHNDYVSRCIYLMNRYGVGADDCTEWAQQEFADYDSSHPKAIATMVKSIYRTHSAEHATLHMPEGERGRQKLKRMEDYIRGHYLIRRNMLSWKLEVAALNERGQPAGGEPLTVDDHFVNSLWREMQHVGVEADLLTIHTILESDFVTDYHPFLTWIDSLPPWDGTTDYIRQFFSMVHYEGTDPDRFFFYTRTWFLAMVASVMKPEVVNHQILTFIGPQGTYKSSFMLHIVPAHLRLYHRCKNNSFQLTKDDYLVLANNMLVQLEEIDRMSDKEVNQLKAYTTMPHVNERPPYARHTVFMPRVASLCATGNNPNFLTDLTGNRRWLPFRIVRIDNPWTADIPYEGMYAQAVELIRRGERFTLNDEEIRQLNEHNRDYQAPDPAMELIVTYFRKPRTEAETLYMTATKIAAKFAPLVKISSVRIGMALGELGFEQVRTKKGRFWKVAERIVADIDHRLPDDEETATDDLPF